MIVYMLIHEKGEQVLSEEDAERTTLPSPAVSWRTLAVLTMMLFIAPKSFAPTKFSEPVTLVVVAMLKGLQWATVMDLVSNRRPARPIALTAWIGAQRILDPFNYIVDVCHQHDTHFSNASYSRKSWTCC